MRKAPGFWHRRTIMGLSLLPLSWLYMLIVRVHFFLVFGKKISKPVIAIGNVTAGGAGKTPTTIAVAKLLMQENFEPHILTRGYGATLHSVTRVDLKKHTPSDVGDEPLLLAKFAPCWVFANRAESAKLAVEAGADTLLMDDGLQHHRLQKDIQLMVVDGEYGLGSGFVMPAGPLREPFCAALKRVDAVVMIGNDKHDLKSIISEKIPIFSAKIKAEEIAPDLLEKPVIAFSGIARPEKFFQTLKQSSVQVVDAHSFADHHVFTHHELQQLQQQALQMQAVLVTTEKDHVRLPEEIRAQCFVLPVVLQFNDEAQVKEWFLQRLAAVAR